MKSLKSILVMVSLVLGLVQCRGAGTQSRDGDSCTAESQPNGDVLITCDDGTTGVVAKASSCQLRPDPQGRGILINCPPSEEWLLIANGPQGPAGQGCEVLSSTVGNRYVTCDNRNRLILIEGQSVSETPGTCAAIQVRFNPLTNYCKGNGE